MNKDKLISLIIRKETYKDTKPFLNDLAAGKETPAKVSAEAVRDILTTDYIIEAKLYAIRYLKDAFEKGNPTFISLVENTILPILMGIAVDQADDKAVIKYAGSSYTKSQELTSFKSILSSVFRMAKQCIIKWGQWIPDPNRKFKAAQNELKKKNVNLSFEFKYFREENYQLFKQFCQKNGVGVTSTANVKNSSSSLPQKSKDPLIENVQTSLLMVQKAKNKDDLGKLENDFNEALNNYLENAENFQDDLVQKWFDQFQKKKILILKKLEGGQSKQSKQSKTSVSPVGVTPGEDKPKQKDKKTQKNGSIAQLEIDSNHKILDSISPSKTLEKKKEEVQKSQKQVTFTDQQRIALKSPKESKKQIESKESQKISSINHESKRSELAKEQKSPKVSKNKGPIIFDDLEEQEFSKPPPKPPTPLQGGAQKSQQFERSRLEAFQTKPIKPLGQQSRSPKATELSRSSKKAEESKSSKMNSQTKLQKVSKDEPKSSKSPSQKYRSEIPKADTNILQDHSISKDSQRVSFSEEEESEYSEEAPPKVQKHSSPPANFKKKPKLDAIQEQNFSNFTDNKSGLSIPPVRSRISEQKATAANKLLHENRQLVQKYQHLSKDYQKEKEQKLILDRSRQKMERELMMLRENQQKMIKKLKSSVPIQDYNNLKHELDKERSFKSQLFQENARLKAEQNSLIQQLNETRNKMNNYSLQEKSKVEAHSRIQQRSERSLKDRGKQSQNILGSQLLKEEIDQDYIRNLTSPSNIHNWLSQVNVLLFKKNCLNFSQIFYRDDYLTILSKSSVYTQNAKQFLSLIFTFQFKSLKSVMPAVRYKNCQELDLWTKPLTGLEMLYTQEMVVGLHANPIKIMKGELKIIEGLVVKFLLPFMYINFLREEQFSSDQFQDIFSHKAEQLIKSKIVCLNPATIKEPQDFKRIFKCSELTSDNKLRFCLSEGISDCIFMGQIQFLRNSKVIIRMLAIPGTEEMNLKARELVDDLSFLIS